MDRTLRDVCVEDTQLSFSDGRSNTPEGPFLCAGPATRAAVQCQSPSTEPNVEVVAAPVSDARYRFHGPTADRPVVEAWAEGYIRFEHRPDLQQHLRSEIRNRCGQLDPSPDQVLHATYFGTKVPNADVENLVLYNIDTSFKVPGRNGIRFEHGGPTPLSPAAAEYSYCYRYALAPRSDAFTDWRQGRTLASFDWADLGALTGEKKLAQVWLALARGDVAVFEPAAHGTPFAVRVQVRPPLGKQSVWGGLVKGIFDGVISAFQAHTDTAVLCPKSPRGLRNTLRRSRLRSQSACSINAAPCSAWYLGWSRGTGPTSNGTPWITCV